MLIDHYFIKCYISHAFGCSNSTCTSQFHHTQKFKIHNAMNRKDLLY